MKKILLFGWDEYPKKEFLPNYFFKEYEILRTKSLIRALYLVGKVNFESNYPEVSVLVINKSVLLRDLRSCNTLIEFTKHFYNASLPVMCIIMTSKEIPKFEKLNVKKVFIEENNWQKTFEMIKNHLQ